MTTSAQAPAAPVKYKRSFKNYLLDAKFQLKWTFRIIFVALAISALMGFFLYRTSQQVTAQSQEVIAQGDKQLAEADANAKLVLIQMTDDYKDDPELAKKFTDEAKKKSDGLKKQREDLQTQAVAIKSQQSSMVFSLVGGLLLMVILIGLLGIYFTHKVVGPIFMMKSLLRQVGDGKLNFYRKPRKGDELQDFFEVFMQMVAELKRRQAEEVKTLEAAMADAKASGASDASLEKISTLRDAMAAELAK